MSVASKNLFAALGSDDEEDSRPVAKPSKPESPSEPKRSTDAAPARGGRGGAARGGRGGERRGGARGGRGRGGASRGGYSNDDAYNDREEVIQNREREPGTAPGAGRGRGSRVRGGREFDRHSQTGRVDTQKSTNQAWGNETTAWESAEPIAKADRDEEKKESATEPNGAAPTEDAARATDEPAAPTEPEKEPEPEDNTQTYAEWVASQAKSDFAIQEARRADQSKWGNVTSLVSKKEKAVEDALFGETSHKVRSVSSTVKKAPKKIILEIEQRFTPVRSSRGGERGGRGGDRSGDRGGDRGGDRPYGRGRGRGDDERSTRGGGRGGRADYGGERSERGGRGGARGGRGGGRAGGGPATVDVTDEAAFPALG